MNALDNTAGKKKTAKEYGDMQQKDMETLIII